VAWNDWTDAMQAAYQWDLILNNVFGVVVGGMIVVTHAPVVVACVRHSALRARKE